MADAFVPGVYTGPPRLPAQARSAARPDTERVVYLYADGGCILEQPSRFGGTWAWRGLDAAHDVVAEASGVVTLQEAGPGASFVTNNLAEYASVVYALEAMRDGWCGWLHSDSEITLGRFFKSYALRGIPTEWRLRAGVQLRRMGEVWPVLLKGHPSERSLRERHTFSGKPVSEHNVACDEAARRAGEAYMRAHPELYQPPRPRARAGTQALLPPGAAGDVVQN